jgi:uncharacterized membrane protein
MIYLGTLLKSMLQYVKCRSIRNSTKGTSAMLVQVNKKQRTALGGAIKKVPVKALSTLIISRLCIKQSYQLRNRLPNIEQVAGSNLHSSINANAATKTSLWRCDTIPYKNSLGRESDSNRFVAARIRSDERLVNLINV